MMKDKLILHLADDGLMYENEFGCKVFKANEEDLKDVVKEIATFLQGFYSLGTREINVSLRTAEGWEDDTEGV